MACWTDFSMTWNGTTTERTSGNVTTTLMRLPELAPTVAEPTVRLGWESAVHDEGLPLLSPVDGVFWLKLSTTSTARATIERELLDEWQALNALYSPYLGEVTLQTTRKNLAAANIIRELQVRALELPPAQGRDDISEGAISHNVGVAYYPVRFRVYYPLWRQSTDETDVQTATTGGATLTTNDNDGVRAVGVRFVISSVVSAPTLLTISASHLPVDWTITNPADADYVDIGYTTRGEIEDGTGGDLSTGVTGEVPIASQAWTVTTTGAGSTCVVTARYRPEFGTW